MGASVVAGMAISNFKHAGSIALGSLLHTIVYILRVLVDAVVNAAEEKGGENGIVVLIGCLLKCCVGCLESLIEYLNTTAYAFMAVSGDSYCKSAWNGFLLTIVGLNGGTCWLIMRYGTKNSDQLTSIWIPL